MAIVEMEDANKTELTASNFIRNAHAYLITRQRRFRMDDVVKKINKPNIAICLYSGRID